MLTLFLAVVTFGHFSAFCEKQSAIWIRGLLSSDERTPLKYVIASCVKTNQTLKVYESYLFVSRCDNVKKAKTNAGEKNRIAMMLFA